jgi:hypothetical protein
MHFIPNNHYLFNKYKGQTAEQILPWFSDGYFNLLQSDEKTLQYNDLRFGSMSGKMDKKEDFIFKFFLADVNGILQMEKERERPQNNREDIERFKKRIFGIKNPDSF